MTHIADPVRYPTKKAFRAAVEANPNSVYLSDPSIVNPVSGDVETISQHLGRFTVTNHPKRSWYACVTRRTDGVFRVE